MTTLQRAVLRAEMFFGRDAERHAHLIECLGDLEEEIDPRYPDGASPEALALRLEAEERFFRAVAVCKIDWANKELSRFRFDQDRFAVRASQGFPLTQILEPRVGILPKGVSEWCRKEMIRPACLEDLLAHAAWTGKHASHRPLAALGSARLYGDGTVSVPYLSRLDRKCRLALHVEDPDKPMPANMAFLGIRDLS